MRLRIVGQGLAALGVALLAILVSRSGGLADPAAADPPRQAFPAEDRLLEDRTSHAVNLYRAGRGLLPLVRSERMDRIAREHSEEMARERYTAHRGPDGTGPAQRVDSHGVRWTRLAENVARTRGVADPVRRAVDGWIHSPSHRTHLDDPGFTETGIGVATGSDGAVYFTQLFLVPEPEPRAAR